MSILATVFLIGGLTGPVYDPPPPPPETSEIGVADTANPYLTPISYDEVAWPDFAILSLFKEMLPLGVTIFAKPLSWSVIGNMLMWRVGVLALMFVIDFVMGKLGRAFSQVSAHVEGSALAQKSVAWRKGVREVRNVAREGRKMRAGSRSIISGRGGRSLFRR